MKPYVYKIIHKTTKQFYIGVRWANKAPALNDFGIIYFTSSKHALIKNDFSNFDRIIVAELNTREEAQLLEERLLNENWGNPLLLNSNIMDRKFICTGHSDETRKKMSSSKKGLPPNNKGKKLSDETKRKISFAAQQQIHTPEQKEKAARRMLGNQCGIGNKSRTGQKRSEEEKRKTSMSMLGKKRGPMSEASKLAMRESAKKRPRVSCVVCKMQMDVNNFARHKH